YFSNIPKSSSLLLSAEVHSENIAKASLVANPGCYSTGAILVLASVVNEGLISPNIVVDSKSGISGAGRTLSLAAHYSEANEDIHAYSLERHRHLAEIEQELQALDLSFFPSITFVPHLVPMTRGILRTCYAHLGDSAKLTGDSLKQIYRASPYQPCLANKPLPYSSRC
ncbi:MAG: Asd/ArgC dimerization domain-containing protein, partial [Dehalococcoidia bacterium]